MPKLGADQADGLRRLLGTQSTRVVVVISGRRGVGKTRVVANLAVALGAMGQGVVVVDENPAPENVCGALGLMARHDLLEALAHGKPLDEALVHGPQGVSVLPAARALQALSRSGLPAPPGESHGQCGPADVILVDAIPGVASNLLPLTLVAQDVIIVVSGAADSITDAYALIKLVHREYGKRHYRVLVSRVRDEQEARAIFANLDSTARRFLGVSLDLMGVVPTDERLNRAAQMGKAVVEAFPETPSAISFRQLARTLTGWPTPKEEIGGLHGFLGRLLRCARLPLSQRVTT